MTASTRSHPLDSPLRRLFDRVATLRFQLLQSETAAANFARMVEEAKRRFQEHGGKLWTGSALVIRDLALWADDPHCHEEFFTVARQTAVADECLELPQVMRHTARNWTMAQAYESFETFLKDVLAAALLHDPSLADQKKLLAHKRCTQDFDGSKLSQWRAFVEGRYRGTNNSELFALARQLAPPLAAAEMNNRAKVNLVAWYSVWSALRHAITHSSGVLHGRNLTELGRQNADSCPG